jgi:hypothetical protein
MFKYGLIIKYDLTLGTVVVLLDQKVKLEDYIVPKSLKLWVSISFAEWIFRGFKIRSEYYY